ncbi:MAG: ROK family protein [Chloroflexi bacterium]|nr:ROK family protein [Chloroflexota bacterium]
MHDRIIAVDLGGTQIRAALFDADAKILDQTAQPTRAEEGADAIYARLVATIRAVGDDWSRVQGIGVGAPGPLDPWRGVILQAPNLPGMDNFPLKARLEKEFGVPTLVGNDANLAALAEHRYGAGRGQSEMIYITISTGIGGGIITNNQLLLGARGFAGEVGHQTLDANGPRCSCGNVGCLEALAAGPAIERAARDALMQGRDSILRALADGDPEKISGALITRAAHAGDALALEVYARAGYYIGLGIVNLLHLFDAQLFVLGGSVAIHAWDFLYPSIRATFDQNAMRSMRDGVSIVPAQLGDETGLYGAMALVIG